MKKRTQRAAPRAYYRESRYTDTLRCAIEPEMAAALRARADADGVSVSVVVRGMLARALTTTRNRRGGKRT